MTLNELSRCSEHTKHAPRCQSCEWHRTKARAVLLAVADHAGKRWEFYEQNGPEDRAIAWAWMEHELRGIAGEGEEP